jgi:DNA-binding transcriptional ArsR family regulator
MAADIDAVDTSWPRWPTMRRRVLDRLAAHGETTATALAAKLPVSRQAVVQHLAVLQHVELVASHRAGRGRRYTVQPQQLTAIARWMTQPAAQWDARLAAIRQLAESSSQTQDVHPATNR